MTNKEETIDMILEKFSNKDLAELLVLKESYKHEIKLREDNHWLGKLQKRTKIDLYTLIRKISIGSLIALTVWLVILIGSAIYLKNNLVNYMGWFMIPLLIVVLTPAMLSQFTDDGTGSLRTKLRAVKILIDKKQSSMHKKIMIDTNIFNKIADGELLLTELEKAKNKSYKFFITHIQSDEISNCNDAEKRARLVLFMTKISPELIDTESTILNKSRLGFAKTGDGEILEKLNSKSNNPHHQNDHLIAETAIKNDYILLTEDETLRKKVTSLGGRAICKKDFSKNIE